MIFRSPKSASLCSVCVTKVIRTSQGDVSNTYGSAFLYRCAQNRIWLVTNWHVLTSRRPDDVGVTIGLAPQSPHEILVHFPSKTEGAFLSPVRYSLYENGKPVWFEYELQKGLDVAAIPIELPSEASGVCIQDFAKPSNDAMEPGIDLILVGFPFPHDADTPFPLWKRAMLASEPKYLTFGLPQMLIDTPGVPGMSGSPVFRSSDAFLASKQTVEAFEACKRGEISSGALIDVLNPEEMSQRTVGLSFVGIYAGSTGSTKMDRLNLGRMFSASAVDLLVSQGQAGINPYPPLT